MFEKKQKCEHEYFLFSQSEKQPGTRTREAISSQPHREGAEMGFMYVNSYQVRWYVQGLTKMSYNSLGYVFYSNGIFAGINVDVLLLKCVVYYWR